jgi:hypothetical protein
MVLVLIFRLHYANDWPTFFDDIFSLLPSNNQSTNSIDSILQIGFTIDQEVVCALIPRSVVETQRNVIIKDLMRERAIPQLISSWQSLFISFHSSNIEISRKCIQLIG